MLYFLYIYSHILMSIMKESYMAQNSLELKTPLQVLPTILCKTKDSLSRRKKWTLRLIMPSSQLAQPLADLQNSLPQPFKR